MTGQVVLALLGVLPLFALLFGLLHRNMVQFPNAFLLGAALGYFMVKTNSIWTSMAIHFLNNFLVVLLSIVTVNMSDLGTLALQGLEFLVYLGAGAPAAARCGSGPATAGFS